ncbi:MAG: DUF1844 domain-containing protein [Deltaproteobacteria bacterium]|nr:MAG: DUF1844 domain-containing protein [Deltaproteobacteria bacterium]
MGEEKGKGFKVIDRRRIGREDAPEEKTDVKKEEPPREERRKEGQPQTGGGEKTPGDAGRVTYERTQQEKDARKIYEREGRKLLGQEAGFGELVNLLAGYAMTALGMLEGPGVQPGAPDLEMARHFIDLLGVVEEKTRGNLSAEEDRLIREALYQLRMIYVQISQQKGGTPSL